MNIVAKNNYATRIYNIGQAAKAVELGRDVAANIPSVYCFTQAVKREGCAAASQCGFPKESAEIGVRLYWRRIISCCGGICMEDFSNDLVKLHY